MKTGALYLVMAIVFCGFIYGAYWLAKHGSYRLWYEDMVKETITEMVKPEALVKEDGRGE